MRQPLRTAAALLLLTAAPAVVPAARADDDVVVRDETASFALEGARRLDIDVPVGEVHVTAGSTSQVQAHFKLRCDEDSRRCRDQAADLRLKPERDGEALRLVIDGYERRKKGGMHHPEVELRLVLPASLAVNVEMGVGELDLRGVEGDVSVELGVGEARVEIPEAAVRSVSMDVGVGEAELRPRSEGQRKSGFLFLGNEVSWREGSGRSRVTIEVGVGEANVQLVP